MRCTRLAAIIVATTFALVTALAAEVSGPTTYTISWSTLDAGGGQASGGAFTLYGAVGQPDTGVATGGGITLTGGFLASASTAPCLGDNTGDGMVDVSDLLGLLGVWGPCPGCPADGNGDGNVDVSDLLDLLGAWGACP